MAGRSTSKAKFVARTAVAGVAIAEVLICLPLSPLKRRKRREKDEAEVTPPRT